MISFLRAWFNQVEQGANSASVCSNPPSEVGAGIVDVGAREDGVVSGRK